MKQVKYYISIISCMLIAMSSCIKEDWSDCPDGEIVQMKFTYNGALDLEANAPAIKTVTTFVFDENDQFVTYKTWPVNGNILDNQFDLRLPEGKYNLVSWVNLDDPYYVTPDIEQLKYAIPADKIAGDIPFLFFGEQEIEVVKNEENTVLVPLEEITNEIRITINGMSLAADPYLFVIKDNNGAYTFDGDFADCEEFSYQTTATTNPATHTIKGSMTVLKLTNDSHPYFSLIDKDGEIIPLKDQNGDWVDEIDLVALVLSQFPDYDFSRRRVHDIEFFFDVNMNLTLKIVDWNEQEIPNIEITPEQ